MMTIIVLIISLLLDGLLTNYLPFLVGNLSLFTPLLTLVSLFVIYPYYRKREKRYFIIIFVVGIIYDLYYTNLLFFDAILFLIIGLVSRFICKNFEVSYLKLILYIVIIITIYELLYGVILLVFNLVPVTFNKILYKILHSLILNILYGEVIFIILKLIPNKYKKISIN